MFFSHDHKDFIGQEVIDENGMNNLEFGESSVLSVQTGRGAS